jgi:hypothetical protein
MYLYHPNIESNISVTSIKSEKVII